jgi:uncharacterized ferredoxin-like protein
MIATCAEVLAAAPSPAPVIEGAPAATKEKVERETIERCAKVCEEWAEKHDQPDSRKLSGRTCLTASLLADKIRALRAG